MTQADLLKLLTAGTRYDKARGVLSVGFQGPNGEWVELGWISEMVPEDARGYFYDNVWRGFVEKIALQEKYVPEN